MTTLLTIAHRIAQADGRAFLVGGAVRDRVLGKTAKDLDVEVHGIDADRLVAILSKHGHVNAVGARFGVLKLRVGDDDFDFSLPRRENKVGRGRKGFQVDVDPTMTVNEAARRRDFTMNAMSQDILTGEVIDPFDGTWDLRHKVLSVVDPDTFIEDPLRVLRGFQFCGRFELFAEQRTVSICKPMVDEFDTFVPDNVWTEWEKWATKSTRPSLGLRFLHEVGWLHKFPELARLVDLEQDELFHPEGDVFTHTCQVVDECARVATQDGLDDEQRTVLVFAGLCHDFGKTVTTRRVDGRITSHGHDSSVTPFARMFLDRIGAPKWLVEQVVPLCENHMFLADPTPRNVRRLARRVSPSSVEMLVRLMHSDKAKPSFGSHRCARCHRPLTDPDSVARGVGPVCAKARHGDAILSVARELECSDAAPRPVLLGRHLMPFMEPGPEMGHVLRAAFDAQLDGAFETVEDGVAWVQSHTS